jgi:hypothetical protein
MFLERRELRRRMFIEMDEERRSEFLVLLSVEVALLLPGLPLVDARLLAVDVLIVYLLKNQIMIKKKKKN